MLKHVCTSWLSIGRCLGRLLDNWDPLKQLFVDAKDSGKSTASTSTYSSKKVEEIASFLRSPTNKLFCLFLAYTIKAFDGVLVRLQAEEPMIHLLHAILSKLLRDLFSRFLKPSALMGKTVHEVEYSLPNNMKDDDDLMIGSLARQFIAAKEANHLRDSRLKEFFSIVRKYFVTTCRYLLEKLPINDPVLINAVVADPCQQLEAKASSLQYMIQQFPCLLQGTTSDMDSILEQFVCYQSTDISSCQKDRADLTWVEIGNQFPSFKSLPQVMLGILTIPHSSAACERVFACVRKNSTDQRASLKQETMEALMVLKSRPSSLQLSDKDLDQLKGAYYNSLKK